MNRLTYDHGYTEPQQLVGKHVEIPAHSDLWMRGARTGTVTSWKKGGVGQSDYALVKMDNPRVKRRFKLWKMDIPYAKVEMQTNPRATKFVVLVRHNGIEHSLMVTAKDKNDARKQVKKILGHDAQIVLVQNPRGRKPQPRRHSKLAGKAAKRRRQWKDVYASARKCGYDEPRAIKMASGVVKKTVKRKRRTNPKKRVTKRATLYLVTATPADRKATYYYTGPARNSFHSERQQAQRYKSELAAALAARKLVASKRVPQKLHYVEVIRA